MAGVSLESNLPQDCCCIYESSCGGYKRAGYKRVCVKQSESQGGSSLRSKREEHTKRKLKTTLQTKIVRARRCTACCSAHHVLGWGVGLSLTLLPAWTSASIRSTRLKPACYDSANYHPENLLLLWASHLVGWRVEWLTHHYRCHRQCCCCWLLLSISVGRSVDCCCCYCWQGCCLTRHCCHPARPLATPPHPRPAAASPPPRPPL